MTQNPLRLSLPQDLETFVRQSSGRGTLFTTAGEFIRSVLREKKARLDAERIRDAILAGYQDVFEGQTVRFDGNVLQLLNAVAVDRDSVHTLPCPFAKRTPLKQF